MFSEDIYSIHGENTQLVATVSDRVREIPDKYAQERCWAEDSREFREFQSMMRGNQGVRL